MRRKQQLSFVVIPGSIMCSVEEIYHASGRHVDKHYQYKILYKLTLIVHV